MAEFCMLILVSVQFKFVTRGLSGSLWWMVVFWSQLMQSMCVQCENQKKEKKHKSELLCPSLFIKKGLRLGNLVISDVH